MRLVVVAVMLTAGVVHASDPPAEARARAALALSSVPRPAAVAPAPRPAAPVTYAEAKKLSLKSNLPVMLYVGCQVAERIPGTVTAVEPSMAGVEPGTVLVCFPHRDADGTPNVFIDARLKCPAKPDQLRVAAAVAEAKVERKKQLDWK